MFSLFLLIVPFPAVFAVINTTSLNSEESGPTSFQEYGCNNYRGLYSSGQCITLSDGTSRLYQCNDAYDEIIIVEYSGDECDGDIIEVDSTSSSSSVNCQSTQSDCEYGVFTYYDSNDGSCDRDTQGTWETWLDSYFMNICITDDDGTSDYYTCTESELVHKEYSTSDCTGTATTYKTSPRDWSKQSPHDYSFYCSSHGVESKCNANGAQMKSNMIAFGILRICLLLIVGSIAN